MRQIKFRAFNKITGMMEVQSLRSFGLGYSELSQTSTFYDEEHGSYSTWVGDVNKESALDGGKNSCVLMQFIGLLDKNGKEIFENDILIIPDEYTDRILDDGSGPTEPMNHLVTVIFNAGCFCVEIIDNGDRIKKGHYCWPMLADQVPTSEIEIIGNIYENPELLK